MTSTKAYGVLAAAVATSCATMPSGPSHVPPPSAVAREGARVSLQTLDGQKVNLADYASKVTLVDVWGTFCEPCLKELPLLEELARKYQGDADVSFVAVAVDPAEDAAKVQAAARAHGLTIPVLLDADGSLRRRFAIDQPAPGQEPSVPLPLLVTIDPDFRFRREVGLRMDADTSFVREHAELIQLALAGTLPREHLPDYAQPGAMHRIHMPAMSVEELDRVWPGLTEQLRRGMSASDAQIAEMKKTAEAQAKEGKPIELDLPTAKPGTTPHAP